MRSRKTADIYRLNSFLLSWNKIPDPRHTFLILFIKFRVNTYSSIENGVHYRSLGKLFPFYAFFALLPTDSLKDGTASEETEALEIAN